MMAEHWFWLLLSVACLVWYTTITLYVAFKGFTDIKNMVRRLKASEPREPSAVD